MHNTLVSEFNKQIQEEMFSSYLYLSMSAYCESKNLKGFANWFTVQAKEEVDHMMGFYHHLINSGEQVELLAIDKPENTFGTPLAMVKKALAHEQHISGRIKKLLDLAKEEKEYAAELFLHWYITEQVEEERNTTELIEKLKMVGDSGASLYLLDKELASRVYVPANIQ